MESVFLYLNFTTKTYLDIGLAELVTVVAK